MAASLSFPAWDWVRDRAREHGHLYHAPDEEGATFDQHALFDFVYAIVREAVRLNGPEKVADELHSLHFGPFEVRGDAASIHEVVCRMADAASYQNLKHRLAQE